MLALLCRSSSLYGRDTSQLVAHIRRVRKLNEPLQNGAVDLAELRAHDIDARVIVDLLLEPVERNAEDLGIWTSSGETYA